MIASWVMEEMQSVDLKDKRLNERVKTILTKFSEKPNESIPAACGGNTEMTAAYRFFRNAKVAAEAILRPHTEATRKRVAAQPVALLVQDTSEIDLSRPEQQVVGAGPLDGSDRRGVLMHSLHAFTTKGTPLGSVWTDMHLREEKKSDEEQDQSNDAQATTATKGGDCQPDDNTNQGQSGADSEQSGEKAKKKKKNHKDIPIEQKESFRWLEGMRKTREVAKQCPDTTCVCVADSEADIYEVFSEEREVDNCHWLVRAGQDRALATGDENDPKRLTEAVENTPMLGTYKIKIRGRLQKVACDKRQRRQPRQSREAEVEVRATQVTLRPPYRPDRKLPQTTVNAVLVREINPPKDDVPVQWLLLTTLPIGTLQEVMLVIQYYCIRWWIEVFFRTLKTGCRVEKRLFEHIDRLLPCLSVYLIVAWRTMFVTHMGRNCPDAPCTIILEDSEWKSVWKALSDEPLPERPPRLEDMVRMVAQLGGYVNYPNREDPPGAQTVWRGLQRMFDLAWAWVRFGPGADP